MTHANRIAATCLMLVALSATGCPTAGGDGAVDDDDANPGGECEREDLWGSFALWTDGVEGGFEGVYHDGPSPLIQEELSREGACILHGFDPMPHCEPGCDPPEVCGAGDECLGWPATLGVGTLRIEGTVPSLELSPAWEDHYYTDTPIPGLVQAGASYTLSAGGSDDVGPFSLTARGVDAFVDAPAEAVAQHGEPLSLTWTPAAVPEEARVVFEVGADHHAGTNAYARCEVADSAGEIQLPSAILDAVIDAGAGGSGPGLGSAALYRYHGTTTPAGPACASFVSYAKSPVSVTLE